MAEPIPKTVKIEAIRGLPAWMKGAIRIYELSFLGIQSAPFYLAVLSKNLEIEQLIRIHRLTETLQRPVLIIADALPPKHRPPLRSTEDQTLVVRR